MRRNVNVYATTPESFNKMFYRNKLSKTSIFKPHLLLLFWKYFWVIIDQIFGPLALEISSEMTFYMIFIALYRKLSRDGNCFFLCNLKQVIKRFKLEIFVPVELCSKGKPFFFLMKNSMSCIFNRIYYGIEIVCSLWSIFLGIDSLPDRLTNI